MNNDIKYKEQISDKGNFWFIENIDQELYEFLSTAEKKARIDYLVTGNMLRKSIEHIVGKILESEGLDTQIDANAPLKTQLRLLKERSLLPSLPKVKYMNCENKLTTSNWDVFIRYFGNTISHINQKPFYPRLDDTNAVMAVRIMYDFVRLYYKYIIPPGLPGFQENLMPIADYHITNAYKPKDADRTGCVREFEAYLKNSAGKEAFHAIIRMYRREDLDSNFITRNNDVFIEASKVSLTCVPDGMTRIEEVSKEDNTTHYIISYIFNRKPYPLTNEILQSADLKSRLQLALRIAESINKLHNSMVPIYHRALSYESIYVDKFMGQLIPYIIKFDFAKIKTGYLGTVIANAMQAKELIKEQRVLKYVAPEWAQAKLSDNHKDIDWAKVDIYSLGVLIYDISTGRFAKNRIGETELELLEDEFGFSADFVDMLELCLSDDPSWRPDIDRICNVLREEIKRWN